MNYLYCILFICILTRSSYCKIRAYRPDFDSAELFNTILNPISSDERSEELADYENFFKNTKLWKILRKRRAHRAEPEYDMDMLGSFGTILWEPKPQPMEKKMMKGYVEDC